MSGPNTVIQYSFSTGAVSPGIRNRKDWQRIDAAVDEVVNGTITPTGAFRRRPGMRFINECLHDDKPITQVTFEFSRDQVYELEFGHYLMRFYVDGGIVTNANGTPYVISTPYSAEEAAEMVTAQDRDTLICTHWDKTVKKLVRYGHTNWVWEDLFTEASTSRIASPASLTWYDNASDGHNGYEYAVTAYRIVSGTPQESYSPPTLVSDPATVDRIPETPQNNIQSCIAWIKKYRPGYGGLAGFPTYPEAFDLSGINEDASPVGGIDLHPKLLAIFKLQNPAVLYGIRGYWSLYGSDGYYYSFEWRLLSSPNTNDIVSRDQYGRSSDGSLENFVIIPLYASGVAAFNYTWFMRDRALNHINTNAVSVNGQTMSSIYSAIVSFVTNYNQNHSQKVSNHLKWSAVPGAAGYYVYRRPMGVQDKNYYLIATVSDGSAHYLEADVSETQPTTKTPPLGTNSFSTPDRYPRICSLYQQRLVLGATKEKPTTIFGSMSGIYTDYTINPSDLSSGYEFKMASQQSNPLERILPLYTLAILTSGGDFISTVTGAMNAANVNFNQKSYNGCSRVKPIIVGDTGLYVPVGQQTINAMSYSYEKDGFAHNNIIFYAQHYAKNKKIVDLAHQRDPINLIWALLDDGTLLSCTYIPQQDFLAWTEHHTDGKVKSINAVPNSAGYDDLYLVVERTLGNGTVKRYLEMLDDIRPYGKTPDAENAYFVDCGLSGTFETPATTITGLEHLEGKEVAILADGSVDAGFVYEGLPTLKKVVNGRVTLDRPATHVHVGLPYRSRLKTLKFDLIDQGTLRNTRSTIDECIVEVEDTRELLYAANGGTFNRLIVHDADDLASAGLLNGDHRLFLKALDAHGTYLDFVCENPVPCTIVSIVAEISHGDS